MYPPSDYSYGGGYPPQQYPSQQYPPQQYSPQQYPPQDNSRSMGGGPPPSGSQYSDINNPSVGPGGLRTQMPSAPGGGNPFGDGPGGPGGYAPKHNYNIGFNEALGPGGFSGPPGPPGGPYGGYGGGPPAGFSGMYPPPPPPGPGSYDGGPYGRPPPPSNSGGFYVNSPGNYSNYGPGGPGGYSGGFNNSDPYPPGPPPGPSSGGFGGNNSGLYPPALPPGPPSGVFGGNSSFNGPPQQPPRPGGGNCGQQRPPPQQQQNQQRPHSLNASAPAMGANQGSINKSSAPTNASAPGINQQHQQGPSGPQPSQFGKPKQQEGTRWANVESFSKLPADAIRGGTYKNEPFYIGRAPYKDSVQVGMVTKSKDGLVITYDGKTLRFHKYEVLCGPPSSVEWEPMYGKFDPKLIRGKKKPIKCGKEKKGEILYAATTSQNGRDYGGKVGANSKYMLYPSSGKEEKAKDYFVLCQVDV